MQELKLKTRIQNKYKTLTEWNSIQEGEFIPLKGEVCYAVDNDTLYQKIGDGATDFTKLDWLFSKAIQSDWNENDTTSSAYIKNRICKIDKTEVPKDEQLLGITSKIDFDIVNIETETGGIPPAALGLPEHITDYAVAQTIEPISLSAESMEKLKNVNNDIQIEIGGFKFDLQDSEKENIVLDDDTPPYYVFMLGNPAMANVFFTLMDIGESPFAIKEDKLNEDFCLLVFSMDGGEGARQVAITCMGDAGVYIPQDLENAIIRIDILAQNTVFPIDGKYLTNAWSDQFEMDDTKPSFIKNRYGDLAQIKSSGFEEDNEDIFIGNYTVTTHNGNNIKIAGTYTNNLPIYGLHGTAKIYYEAVAYDVSINGIVYEKCPLTTTSTVLIKGDTHYFIGNPFLITTAMNLDTLGMLPEYINNSKVCHLEDNGLPFLLILKNDLNTAQFLDDWIYGTEDWLSNFIVNDSIEIKISESVFSVATHLIPTNLLPYELSMTNWLFDVSKNAIASKSAYFGTTPGVNSFAVGQETKATGSNSVAMGYKSQASGENSLAIGYCTSATKGNSVAMGKNTTASGFMSLAMGSDGTKATGQHSIAFGANVQASGNSALALGIDSKASGSQSIALAGGTANGSKSIAIGKGYAGGTLSIAGSEFTRSVGDRSIAFATGSYIPQYFTDNTTFGNGILTDSAKTANHVHYISSKVYEITVSSDITEEEVYEWNICYTDSEFAYISYISKKYENVYEVNLETPLTYSTDIKFAVATKIMGLGTLTVGPANKVFSTDSATFGKGLISNSYNENALISGHFNAIDNSAAFIIGNGNSLIDRSNAFTVGWNGNVKTAGSIETSSVILTSPNGTQFTVSIDDNGILTATEIIKE